MSAIYGVGDGGVGVAPQSPQHPGYLGRALAVGGYDGGQPGLRHRTLAEKPLFQTSPVHLLVYSGKGLAPRPLMAAPS